MKRLAISVFIFSLTLWLGFAPGKAADKRREKAVVEFTQTVKLQGKLLRGEYVIVHDEERMARGEPCTWIYRSEDGREGALVLAFHCEHVERARAEQTVVRLSRRSTAYDTPEVQEFQFAGSTAGHKVPGV